MSNASDIKRIKKYLKDNGMTLSDIGVEGSLKDLDEETILSILDDIYEDEARQEYDEYLEDEAFEAMLDADEEMSEETKEKTKKT